MPRPIQISLRRFGLNHPTNIIERMINFRNGRSLQCSSLLFLEMKLKYSVLMFASSATELKPSVLICASSEMKPKSSLSFLSLEC